MKIRRAKQDEPLSGPTGFSIPHAVFSGKVFTEVPLQHSLLTFSIEGNQSVGGSLTNDR